MSWIQTGSSIIFLPYTLEEALRGLARAGFTNVEIGAVKGFLEHLDPDDPDVDGCRSLLEEHGLRFGKTLESGDDGRLFVVEEEPETAETESD